MSQITLKEFAEQKGVSYDTLRQNAYRNEGKRLTLGSEVYLLIRQNGSGNYIVILNEEPGKKVYRHLSADERKLAIEDLTSGLSTQAVADKYSISYHTALRLSKKKNTERRKRTDAGKARLGVPPGAFETFEQIYLSNAQRNARIAYERTVAHHGGIYFPYRYALAWAQLLKAFHLRANYAKQFESQFTPKIRRDLWTEFDFMECVSQDGWHIPCWVIGPKGNDVQPRAVMAVDSKTGYPLSIKFMLRDENHEDIMALNLDLVYNWGRPSWILMDNGRPFIDENTQRFLRGWWKTEEHEARTRIVFSEPYRPEGKGRHERLHKIFQDEFCAFLPDYSPNPRDSRKPEKQLSHVKASLTFEEFQVKFLEYLNGPFMYREREMWRDPNYTEQHERNIGRPKTMREAFDRAYLNYQPYKLEHQRLAFLYAQKYCKQYRDGVFTVTINREVFRYIPENFDLSRINEHFNVVVNPVNLGQAWIVNMNEELVTEAADPRYKDAGMTRERAARVRKVANKLEKQAKDRVKLVREMENIDPIFAEKFERRAGGREEISVKNIEDALYTEVQLSKQSEQPAQQDEDELDQELVAACANYNQQQEDEQ